MWKWNVTQNNPDEEGEGSDSIITYVQFIFPVFFFLILSFFNFLSSIKTKQKPTNRKDKQLDVCRRLLFKPMASEDRNYLLDGTNEQDTDT